MADSTVERTRRRFPSTVLVGNTASAREDFVYEPAVFHPGGIIDIFSFGNEYPYRIELFDEEVKASAPSTPRSFPCEHRPYPSFPISTPNFLRSRKCPCCASCRRNRSGLKDFQVLLDKLTQCFEKAEDLPKPLAGAGGRPKEIFRDRAFIRPNESSRM